VGGNREREAFSQMNAAATRARLVRFFPTQSNPRQLEDEMDKILLLAGAAALGIAAPSLAAPGGGHGGGMAAHVTSSHANIKASAVHSPSAHASVHATAHARNIHATTHARTHARKRHATTHATTHARNAHAATHAAHAAHAGRISAHDQALAHKYGGALCPPGLYKKTPSCMPPGQAKRIFHSGQRVPTAYKYYTPFTDIPQPLVTQYDLTDQYRYIYRNNVIYVVDPATSLITRIIDAVL
jgi:hypothetical protein